MKVTMTPRGFQSLQFVDEAGNRCIAEQSSAVDFSNPTYDRGGSSYLLLGRQDAPAQLNIEQVGELVEYLQKWLEDGEFLKSVRSAARQESAEVQADHGLSPPHLSSLARRHSARPK